MASRLYTRRGDSGMTSLANGERVPKGCDEVEAYGTLDELNSHVGMLLLTMAFPEDQSVLLEIQKRLFDAGSVLSESPKAADAAARLDVEWLERQIDAAERALSEKRTGFVLPCGAQAAAWAHICRSICRRAERCMCRLQLDTSEGRSALAFVNRLSDYFFALAQKINKFSDIAEIKA